MRKLFFLLMSVILVMSCHKCKDECDDPTNKECPNYVDPCASLSPFTADFKMVSYGGIEPSSYEILDGDTGWCLQTMGFITRHEVDSVKWLLGTDPTIRTQTSLTINFGLPYYNVPVTCIAYGKQNSECFGTELVTDTVVKHINVVHWPDLPIWTWRFMCHYSDEPETEFEVHFEIEVNANSPPNWPMGDRELYGLAHIEECQFAGCGQFNHSYVYLNGAGSHPSGCSLDDPTYNPFGTLMFSADKRTVSGMINSTAQRTISGYRTN